MTDRRLRLLLVEDSADDAEMIDRALRSGGIAPQTSKVDSEAALRIALDEHPYDLAITDHELPGFDSTGVMAVLDELAPDLPCLLVSGKVGEEAVGSAMRHGVADYVAKDGLGGLPSAVERALAESEQRRARRAADEALVHSGQLFEAVFLNAGDAMLIADDDRRLVAANPAAALMFATPRDDLVGRRIDDLLPEGSRSDASASWDEFLGAGEGCGEMELVRPAGGTVSTEYTAAAHFIPGRHILVMRDISARRGAEAEAQRHAAQQKEVAEFGERALREGNIDLLMEAATDRVASTLGVEIASILELSTGECAFLTRAETTVSRGETRVPHGSSDSSQASFTVRETQPVLVNDCEQESRFARDPALRAWGVRSVLTVKIPGHLHPFGVLEAASASPRAFEEHDKTFLAAIANILADALTRAKSEEEMRNLALHDSLTGLPNRTLFFDRLTVALARTARLGTRVAVLFLDIDHFKSFNDTLGHRATDRLLTQVGARIERTMRETDTVARFGGDEFVVLCEDLDSGDEAEILTSRLVSAFEVPFSFGDEQHELSASIGVALSDSENLDGEALLRDADIAMYRSKEGGRGMATVSSDEMRQAVVERFETKRALEKAIATDQLRLHYQPIVALDSGEISAVEALVRWEHPERGLVPPGQFIPVAEESVLIVRLGEWVLRAACLQAARWRAEFGDQGPLPIHVNLSARQAAQLNLPELVGKVLDETGVPPGDIALEITETALIEGVRGPMVALGELKKMGMSIVLDDFGTGFSSLSYLDRFPIDTLKIDRAFVSQLEGPTAPAPIVTAIVGMARALAVETVAEGVETAEQTAAVTALGCSYAQGYFFARPAPAEQITALMRDDQPLRDRAAEAHALAPPSPGPAAENSRWGVVGVAKYRELFLAALREADSQTANDVVRSALASRIPADAIDTQIIGLAMIEIGALWQRSEISVAEEHLATGIASQAAALAARDQGSLTARLSTPLPERSILLATAEGDDHVLGLRMVADMLEALDLDVQYLGSKVPSADLCELAAHTKPDVIGLSLTLPDLALSLEEQVLALRLACPEALLLLGGQGVSLELAERVGARYMPDVEALVAAASNGLLRPAPTLVAA